MFEYHRKKQTIKPWWTEAVEATRSSVGEIPWDGIVWVESIFGTFKTGATMLTWILQALVYICAAVFPSIAVKTGTVVVLGLESEQIYVHKKIFLLH